MGTELEVDAIVRRDGCARSRYHGAHRAGRVHSGDSIAVYPAWNVSPKQTERLIRYSTQLALALHTRGLINIQYVIHEELFM